MTKLCGIDRLAGDKIYVVEESDDYLELERQMEGLIAKQKREGRDPGFENYFLEPDNDEDRDSAWSCDPAIIERVRVLMLGSGVTVQEILDRLKVG